MALAKIGKRGNNTGHFYSKRVKGTRRGSPEWVAKVQAGRKRFFDSHPDWKPSPRGKDRNPRIRKPHDKQHIFMDKEAWRAKISAGMKRYNETHPEEAARNREMIRKIGASMVGPNNRRWIADRSTIDEKRLIRDSMEYRLWREAVFARDHFTCQECGAQGCELNADHVKPFALFPELRTAIDNGRTLCVPCHMKTPTWGGRTRSKKVKEMYGDSR